ncbi:hypothetical protein MCOR27_004396 [Pyricularia oryzae]|nr:hypothetical protein OOU_Y34scaffold00725g24 [Pyricularia oryzae Y34]KAH8842578.1 hypothetical protein MCOR01_006481 [Pyricularia oryzae]KAI6302573.1 hypothetical protein MCOR33_002160 [Pyricularia grisea]KAH9435828.1 hypothetical protein MCOR02_004746 [Pyricularia oryzae]KAI6260946.1 hypothetical protein MCOR19_002814 [Pyricularia oryzae]
MGKPAPPKGNRPTRNTQSQPKKQTQTTKTTKKQTPAPERPARSVDKPNTNLISLPDQQKMLNLFSQAFNAELTSPDFTNTLQAVKQGLFDRDFERVFGDEANLRVYAARYSPTRALGYAEVLSGIFEHLELLLPAETGPDEKTPAILNMVSIGGGAAEVAAFAAYLSQAPDRSGAVTLIDSGPWGAIVDSLASHVTTPPILPQWANAEAMANNRSLIEPARLAAKFLQKDVLSSELVGIFPDEGPCLVTLFFTLNELFTAGGIGKTTQFLLDVTAVIPSGSLLLVVDSPGSYSEATVGKEAKKYPMLWLLDKVLATAEDCTWQKMESQESRWFRLPEKLTYPIPLENMRFQMHLYRAKKPVFQAKSNSES